MEDLECLSSRNSSRDKLRSSLNADLSIGNFAVSADRKIYLDHHTSHEHVEADNDLSEEDILARGI